MANRRDAFQTDYFISARSFCGNVKLMYIVQVKILVRRVRYTGGPHIPRIQYPRFTAARKKNWKIK